MSGVASDLELVSRVNGATLGNVVYAAELIDVVAAIQG